ncbi:MAG: RNA polymerase sigma factor [Candidatus Merdivicinus sp.]
MDLIEIFYRTYKEDLYRYLLRQTRDPVLAEELLAETFLQAIRALPGYRQQSPPEIWLCGIARRVWLRNLRRESKREIPVEDELLALYLTDYPEEQTDIRLRLERVKILLNQMDERSKKIILLRAEGYSYREIAVKIEIRENSARVLECRARKWLLQTLEKEGL